MPSAFTALANIKLTAAQTSISFTSISQSYRDLYLVLTLVSGTGGQPLIKVNNDAGLNYNGNILRANGTTVASTNINGYNYGATLSLYANNSGANDMFYDIWLPDYATTDKHKNLMIRANGASSGVEMNVSKWNSTTAVSSLILYFTSGNFGIGTTATLYGVSA